ncbi:MAG: bifunctional 5,10-methylenetetrahydrofolate dehydrogenase/5,10-methenyltetrahydrofolate cyclohydrolase [Bacteroidota bacterium]
MNAKIIDGKKIAAEIKERVRLDTEDLKRRLQIVPGLAFVLVGENPASQSYVRMKGKACEEMGFYSITERFSETVSETLLLDLIKSLNENPMVHGILIQLPLPRHINEHRVLLAIDYRKDVDGFHPINVGRLIIGQPCLKPCTPLGIQELLIRSGNDPAGKHVVVLGRSNIVGKPIANILLQKQHGANAVVTIAHTGAANISTYTRQADILIAAMGKAECITADMVKEGVVVIDVGTNRISDPSSKTGYKLTGDVHFESVIQKAKAITPVPGGVGPMTIAMLMHNTLEAAIGNVYSKL